MTTQDNLVLTDDQQVAYTEYVTFLLDPTRSIFVLGGYAGTGKTTLVDKMVQDIQTTLKTARLLSNKKIDWKVQLTATTNKACEAMQTLNPSHEVRTIQSFLGLRVQTNFKTKETALVTHEGTTTTHNTIIFIDEASYIDRELLHWIKELCIECKIIYIGDPAQLAPVNSNSTPVFNAGYDTVNLTKIVRQAENNPIITLATNFRHTVNDGQWRKIVLDSKHVIHLDQSTFENEIIKEFNRVDYKNNDAKVLAWRNAAVIHYNHEIRNIIQGVPHLEKNDYAVCNKYFKLNRKKAIKTDQLIQVTNIKTATDLGIPGWTIEINNVGQGFMPTTLEAKKELIKHFTQKKEYDMLKHVDEKWIDLRAAYACTVNKSQGSTYDRVFIDLNDIGRCRNGNTMARMLYVATSRARYQVILTGDLA